MNQPRQNFQLKNKIVMATNPSFQGDDDVENNAKNDAVEQRARHVAATIRNVERKRRHTEEYRRHTEDAMELERISQLDFDEEIQREHSPAIKNGNAMKVEEEQVSKLIFDLDFSFHGF